MSVSPQHQGNHSLSIKLMLQDHSRLQMEGCQPNVVTYNTLVDLYGKIGRPADAVATLDTMQMHVSPFPGCDMG